MDMPNSHTAVSLPRIAHLCIYQEAGMQQGWMGQMQVDQQLHPNLAPLFEAFYITTLSKWLIS